MISARFLAGTGTILLALELAFSAGARTTPAQQTLCGTERWKVKTVQDRPQLLPVQTTTIAHLIAQPKTTPLPGTRAPFERHQFRVTAQVTNVLPQADGDFRLVLQDSAGHTMIAEAPSAACDSGATAQRRTQIAQARAVVKLCTKAELTGVAFFDFFHHQDGVAPNEIELHPILAFKCLVP